MRLSNGMNCRGDHMDLENEHGLFICPAKKMRDSMLLFLENKMNFLLETNYIIF